MPVISIRLEDLPTKIRARLNLPPLPPEPREKRNVDFYELQAPSNGRSESVKGSSRARTRRAWAKPSTI